MGENPENYNQRLAKSAFKGTFINSIVRNKLEKISLL
jgi:hypothetical protein